MAELDRGLRAETPPIGLWLDTSDLTVSGTVDAILSGLDEARVARGRRAVVSGGP